MPFKHKICFKSVVKASADYEKDMLISQASLDDLKNLVPHNVNFAQNSDLIGAAFNVAVANLFNDNGDGIDTSIALSFKEFFKHKPVNIEHKKNKIIGHVVNSGLSSFVSNKILQEKDIEGSFEPFNIALAAVLYKSLNEEFCQALTEASDPKSKFFQKVSASWEIGYNDYFIAIGSKNLSECEIITDEKQIKELSPLLKAFGGSGKMKDNTVINSLIINRLYPLGVGLTINPAAEVQGVAVVDEDNDNQFEAFEIDSVSFLNKYHKKISHKQKDDVKISKSHSMDEYLKQILAKLGELSELATKTKDEAVIHKAIANVSVDIAEHIKAKNEEYMAQTQAAEKLRLETETKAKELDSTVKSLTEKLSNASQKISDLEAIMTAKASAELFSSRMAALDCEYDFDDADRKVLATDLKSLDCSEASFEAFKNKVAVIYKHKNKASKIEAEKQFEARVQAEASKMLLEAKIEGKDGKPVDLKQALASVKAENAPPPSAPTEHKGKETLVDRYAKFFNVENVTLKNY